MFKRLFLKVRKPQAFIPLALFALFLLFAGILAITQESADDSSPDALDPEDLNDFDIDPLAFEQDGGFDEWVPPGPPRWFRSNAGGMTLEETPSRLAALRNKYALVVDYLPPYEVEPRLVQFYQDGYSIEIHVLYEQGKVSRTQWLFRGDGGVVRLNAVFKPSPEDPAEEQDETSRTETAAEDGETALAEVVVEAAPNAPVEDASGDVSPAEDVSPIGDVSPVGDIAEVIEIAPATVLNRATLISAGFVELYNENSQIIQDRWLYEGGHEIIVSYFYNKNILVQAETSEVVSGGYPVIVYTDSYRYNRAFSLRYVERLYHEVAEAQPVRLSFPYRVLEAAADSNFIGDKLYLSSDFMGNFAVGEGFRMVYETDSRGRILTQTLINVQDETVWVIKNTWSGDRIVSVLKTEGDDNKLTEFEYNNDGDRIVQRDLNNGVLERLIVSKGDNDTEELYMNGVVVLRAYWENGRKIREERVRRQ